MARLAFMGIQGSGKGTQADLMQHKHGLAHITVGDLFRSNIRRGTDIGEQARDYVENGLLVPDNLVLHLVEKALAAAGDRYVLDGFPRNQFQAEHLLEAIPIEKAVLFVLSDSDARARITARRMCNNCGATYHIQFHPPKVDGVCDRCGGEVICRDDDNPEAVSKRMKDFHTQTDNVVRLFDERGILLRVDANQPVENVYRDAVRVLRDAGIKL
ncbi:MAG: nucleoside monophosphate kinase [Candidatus Cloacimonetes bacterium]|nr:nucleoside monophosphate kinase [Candidatus Cloacimonadota bacterium]